VFATEMHVRKDDLAKEFLTTSNIEPALIIPEVSVLFAKSEGIDHPSLHIVISENAIDKPVTKHGITSKDYIRIFFFLVNPGKEPRQQLRMLSRIIDIVERKKFVNEILSLNNHRKIKEYLLHNDRYITIHLIPGTRQAEMIGQQIKEIRYPSDILVALIERDGTTFTPNGNTRLQSNDALTIIGEPKSITQLFKRYTTALQ
jgi:basic amino acid/polyamine antiporter, APA family